MRGFRRRKVSPEASDSLPESDQLIKELSMKIFTFFSALLIVVSCQFSFAQVAQHDTALFVQPKNEFFDSIETSLDKFYHRNDTTVIKEVRPDFSTFDAPKSVDEFTQYWHNPPISQGNTGTCWCFSTTSFP